MDSRDSEDKPSGPVTRSKKLSSVKGLSFEATPREPIRKPKRKSENQATATTVNGTEDGDTVSENGESPSKKSRLDAEGAVGGKGDEIEMDVDESAGDAQKNEDQGMGIKPVKVTDLQNIYKGPLGTVNLSPRVELGERWRPSSAVNQDPDWMKSKKAAKAPAAPTKSATHISSPVNRHDVLTHKQSSMADYRRKMEVKAESAASSLDISKVNHLSPSVYPRQRVNNIPGREPVLPKKSDIQKTAATSTRPRNSSRGFTWCKCGLVLVVLFVSATLLSYKIPPLLQGMASGGGHPSRAVKPETFTDHLSILKTQFPSQRHELWKMSKIHLEKHLKTAHPTEPVSMIFTAGQKAERTLQCLAKGLASSFSSAFNTSFLHIDGKSKADQDSDNVKLDIDRQLQAAFEGEKPVAIIHRLEELPPGSTLIFYRYCDHENAAYKRVFLLFTVLLPQDEIQEEKSLKEVEEMVQDYLKEKLVDSNNQAAFDIMNNDKFSGLWSRISHLVLPVVSEVEVEKQGC
ncbi:torsin-1A-interacting protein 2-like isoform X2 [Archocentrus centrarchus]|uniref:torsin-1A-interacting protein 2-like isoform X2 n=1 Tax=Archocentrus centrarchus TaxID=63155 RepID=UPI0011EA0D49|nr:torsin-1A-interacting protein 2-like isoform X2 [Archocentrus centrarchus]